MVKLNSIKGISSKDNTVISESIVARTKDGIKIIVDLSVEYRLGSQLNLQLLSQLINIYNSIGYGWADLTSNICKGLTIDIISLYNVFELYTKRVEIQNLLFNELNFTLSSQNYLLNSALILNLEFPNEFKTSQATVEVTQQNIIQAQ